MTRKVKELRDLEIDEVSLVDKGANQHARTVIAKRHDEEDNMEDYFDEEGNPVDVASIEPGDIVYDEKGNAFEAELDEDEEYADEYEEELVGVGKSFTAADLRVELSKAMSDDERDEIVSKAFDQLSQYQEIAKQAAYAADRERDLRLDREYTEVAKNYAVGVAPDELGPVLKRLAENMSADDCIVIAKALDSATAANDFIYRELGTSGMADNNDVFAQVEAHIDTLVSKADGSVSREAAISKVFDENPAAYDEYLAEQRTRNN